MHYSIRHITRFRYSSPISESIMELRMQPRSEHGQRCLDFRLQIVPPARVLSYHDYYGNAVHHFSLPRQHTQLTITAEALVEAHPPPEPPEALPPHSWHDLAVIVATDQYWDFQHPSFFARPTELLCALMQELQLVRGADPLSTLRHVNTAIYEHFSYAPNTTRVDSPIDDALRACRGVCQDFAHIMIAMVRELGIPCRYVSGYLFHRTEDHDRSEEDATHAWVEALLPDLGWVGFDPTNNLIAGERHIRVAVGRDYADVPPTHGFYRGQAASELAVTVQVSPSVAPPSEDDMPAVVWVPYAGDLQEAQQQQQQ